MSTFMEVLREGGRYDGNEAGYAAVRAQQSAAYRRNFLEAARLYDRVLRGDRWAMLKFQEALTTSDFPKLFGDIIDRQVLSAYQETPYSWSAYVKRGTIQDFRTAKRFRIDGATGVLDTVGQLSEYKERKLADDYYSLQLTKYGNRMPFAWETLVNDDLDAIKDTPARFGRAARRTEEKAATSLFANNTTYFAAANKNIVTSAVNAVATTNNPPLSVTALGWAVIIASSQVDKDGEPISIDGWTLVVPPALDITARNIINATQIWMNDQGGTVSSGNASLQRLITQNWATGRVKPVVNYYLPIVDTAHGSTGWYLFANPSNGRPAMELAFLRGHESPEIFMKLPNQVAVGEGSMGPGTGAGAGTMNTNPLEGDFDTDSVHYKVRHVLGGTMMDPLMAVYSNGSGS
jgi:hypothetical protein